MGRRGIIEELNYSHDPRVIAAGWKWWEELDLRAMKATLYMAPEDDPDDEILVTTPVRFEVCPLCQGAGLHVNPSIDAGGISAEDFARDPNFMIEYLSGMYDVPCNQCYGRRVVPVPTDERVCRHLVELAKDRAAFRAECESERRMGA